MNFLKTVLIAFIVIISACKAEEGNNTNNEINENFGDQTKVNKEIMTAGDSAVLVADSIMYITEVVNVDPEEAYYMNEWLSGAKTEILANFIFEAVYNKRLKAYDYITGKEMTLPEVETLESEWKRENIGQILFTEDWYFDEKELKMYKQVNSIMLAYLRYDSEGNVSGNKSGIRIYLNDTKPMKAAQDY